MTTGKILHNLPLPIDTTSGLPTELFEQGVPETVYRRYIHDVRALYDEVGWSRGKDFWIATLVVFVVTIPFVFRWFSKRNHDLAQRLAEFNRLILPYGVFGRHNSPPKGPASLEFCLQTLC